MTREQLIECMAKALYAAHGYIHTDDDRMFDPFPWDEADDYLKVQHRHEAKSAFDALTAAGMVIVPREPTEAMIRAGHHHIDWCRDKQDTSTPNHSSQKTAVGGVLCGSFCGDDLRDAYRAMTEAANE